MKNKLITNLYFKVYNKLNFNDSDFNEFIDIIDNCNNIVSFCNIEFNFLLNFIFKRDYQKYEMLKNKLLLKLKDSSSSIPDSNLENELNIFLNCKYSNGILDINTCNTYILKYLNDDSLLTKCILIKEKNNILKEISIYILETVLEDFTMNKEVEITGKELTNDINININNKLIAHVDSFLELKKTKPRGQYSSSKNIIRLSEIEVINLEYNNVKILDTIFHEIYHSVQLYKQYNDINVILNSIDTEMRKDTKVNEILGNKIVFNESEDFMFIDYDSYLMKKESLLVEILGISYNDLNYYEKFIEIKARLNAHKELKEYLFDIGIFDIYFYHEKVDIEVLITEENKKLQDAIYKKENKKSEKSDINTIFEKYLTQDIIKKYTIFKLEYNDDCTLKNAKQLLNDLEVKLSKTNDINKINKVLDLYYNLIINNYDKKLIIEYDSDNSFIINLKKKLIA